MGDLESVWPRCLGQSQPEAEDQTHLGESGSEEIIRCDSRGAQDRHFTALPNTTIQNDYFALAVSL